MVSSGYVRSPCYRNIAFFASRHIYRLFSSPNLNESLITRADKIGAVHIKTDIHCAIFQAPIGYCRIYRYILALFYIRWRNTHIFYREVILRFHRNILKYLVICLIVVRIVVWNHTCCICVFGAYIRSYCVLSKELWCPIHRYVSMVATVKIWNV